VKRVLAVLAALAMVVAAWWIRSAFIDGDGGTGTGGGDELHLTCGSDLADVCKQLAADDGSIRVTVVAEGMTADQLSGDDAEATFDAWLTTGPWAQIVADNRSTANSKGRNPLGGTSEVLGRSPVTFVGPTDRLDALAAHCGGTATWVCIGDASGQRWDAVGGNPSWGQVKAGLAPPDSGAGLVALDQAMADKADRTDWDLTDLDDASQWMSQLVGAAEIAANPLNLLLTRPGSFSIAAPLERQSGPQLQGAADGSRYSLLYPEPVVTADVTLSAAAGGEVDDLIERIGADRLSEVLAEHGWRVDGQPSAAGVGSGGALPKGANLASPGALQALREQWRG